MSELDSEVSMEKVSTDLDAEVPTKLDSEVPTTHYVVEHDVDVGCAAP